MLSVLDKPRVGVKTYDGIPIGFIFAEHSSSVRMLRSFIFKQVLVKYSQNK